MKVLIGMFIKKLQQVRRPSIIKTPKIKDFTKMWRKIFN